MIKAGRDVHHRPDDHLTVADDGTLLQAIQAEDGHLGHVDDGGGESASDVAHRCDGERATTEVIERCGAIARVYPRSRASPSRRFGLLLVSLASALSSKQTHSH